MNSGPDPDYLRCSLRAALLLAAAITRTTSQTVSRATLLSTPLQCIDQIEPILARANRSRSLGRSYTPLTTDVEFRERGVASWYGKQFHGNRTASGEIYDMFAMTAAHPTLPLPSYVRVTSVKTRQSVIVRVNDRGPFKSDRIIDLSYAAASKLRFVAAGVEHVEIERITIGR